MGAIVSIARKFEEYSIARKLCLIFFSKNKLDKSKSNPKTQYESLKEREVPRTLTCRGGSPNGYEVSESMTSTLNEIMMALTQPNVTTLGVYGSGNVRKGTLVEKITRRVKRDKLFDAVVMASVTKKPNLKRIQGELGSMLGLQLHEKTLEGRVSLLCDRIKMEEKILVILDDVWGGINLGWIGIPYGNDHQGCKILLTSQDQEVLSHQMNTQIQISV